MIEVQIPEEQRKFEAVLKFYEDQVMTCVCNRARLHKKMKELVEYCLEEIEEQRRLLRQAKKDLAAYRERGPK